MIFGVEILLDADMDALMTYFKIVSVGLLFSLLVVEILHRGESDRIKKEKEKAKKLQEEREKTELKDERIQNS